MYKTDTKIKRTLRAISSEVLNGENYNRSDFARSILNYPAMMVPSVQEPIIKGLADSLSKKVSLIDPFMGASNTLVTAMKYGLEVFGQDINPLSLLISQVKTAYYTPCELNNSLELIICRIEKDKSSSVTVKFNSIDKWFRLDVQITLSKIRRAILSVEDLKIRRFFWVALGETIRLVSNDRTSTFKLHARPIEEIISRKINPFETFVNIANRSIKDVLSFCNELNEHGFISHNEYSRGARVSWGNSMKEIKTDRTFNLLVTSPPYGDNQTTVTYGQFSFLLLQWIPIIDIDPEIDFEYLKTTLAIDANSLGGKMRQDYDASKSQLFSKSRTLAKLFSLYSYEEEKKAKKVINFFSDLDVSIDKMLDVLEPGAFMVWTVGNRSVNRQLIQNDCIITELMESKGVSVITDLSRDILSKRMPGRNNFSPLMNKEKIMIYKTPTN